MVLVMLVGYTPSRPVPTMLQIDHTFVLLQIACDFRRTSANSGSPNRSRCQQATLSVLSAPRRVSAVQRKLWVPDPRKLVTS